MLAVLLFFIQIKWSLIPTDLRLPFIQTQTDSIDFEFFVCFSWNVFAVFSRVRYRRRRLHLRWHRWCHQHPNLLPILPCRCRWLDRRPSSRCTGPSRRCPPATPRRRPTWGTSCRNGRTLPAAHLQKKNRKKEEESNVSSPLFCLNNINNSHIEYKQSFIWSPLKVYWIAQAIQVPTCFEARAQECYVFVSSSSF